MFIYIPSPRTTLLVTIHIILLIAGFFTAQVPFDGRLALVSTIFTFLLFSPSALILVRWLGLKQGLLLLAVLALLAVGIEAAAIKTGFPYGHFFYNTKAGIMIGDLVPVSTPFAWIAIVLGSAAMAAKLVKKIWQQIIATVLIMICIDLLLDPVAVTLGLWYWFKPGLYYGVPFINYVGWVLSASIGSLVVFLFTHKRFAQDLYMPAGLASSLYLSLLLWIGIAFWKGLLVPFMIGVLFLLFFRRTFSIAIRELI